MNTSDLEILIEMLIEITTEPTVSEMRTKIIGITQIIIAMERGYKLKEKLSIKEHIDAASEYMVEYWEKYVKD